MITVDNPQLEVVLFKNIGVSTAGAGTIVSQRYAGTNRVIDLTNWLGETSSISISKSVREAYGSFEIVLADNFVPGSLDSLARLVNPFDVVEIRASRTPHTTAGLPLPLLMRGYVRLVGRRQRMTDQGPQRVVVIQGGDCGVLLDICRSNLYPAAVQGQLIQQAFTFFSKWFPPGTAPSMPASQFVEGCVNNILNPMIQQMQAVGEFTAEVATNAVPRLSPVRTLSPQALVQEGSVYLTGIDGTWSGNSLYGLLAQYGDIGTGANELFTQSFDGIGDYLIFRPVPFKNVAGRWISAPYSENPPAASNGIPIVPPSYNVYADEVVELQSQRDDSKVFNFIWLASQFLTSFGEGAQLQQAWAAQSAQNIVNSPNSLASLYGFRMLSLASQEGPRVGGEPGAAYQQATQTALQEVQAKVSNLVALNEDNLVFESGHLTIRGRPDITAGSYINLVWAVPSALKGAAPAVFTESMYVTRATHQITPFGTWTMSCEFERGDGFIAAAQNPGSPYFMEMAAGVGGVYS